MRLRLLILITIVMAGLTDVARAAGTASGWFGTATMPRGVRVDPPNGSNVEPRFAIAYRSRDPRNPRETVVEILLTDVELETASMVGALSPRRAALAAEQLRHRRVISLWVRPDGTASMAVTGFSSSIQPAPTQWPTVSTIPSLKIITVHAEWAVKTASRVEGHVFSGGTIRMGSGAAYAFDLRFAVDVTPGPPADQLPLGGGDAGKALMALLAAVNRSDWDTVKTALSTDVLQTFAPDTMPIEKIFRTRDLLSPLMPITQTVVTNGQVIGDRAILDVETVLPGTTSVSLVRMVRSDGVWRFDEAAYIGQVQ